MDIIFMEPVYKNYIWGGEKLKSKFNKNTPFEKTAESWEISANKNGLSMLKNSEYKEKDLKELFDNKALREIIFGRNCKELKEFPLLVKFIDAKENLSIQVHPDNEYAKTIGIENGKTEMWYVIECEKDGMIIGGLKSNLTKKELENSIKNNTIKDYLKYIKIKEGDSIYIPAGTIHAILKDTLVCEIQQNSDITYRVYDWDRKDKNGNRRQLHKKEAMETIKIQNTPSIVHSSEKLKCQKIVESKFFEVQKINCEENYEDCSNLDTFYIINVIEGEGYIENIDKKYIIKKGNSFLIPATLGKYKISGKLKFLKSYVV